MILENTFKLDKGNKEIVPLTSPGFPYVCIITDLDSYRDGLIEWHWHTAYEIVHVSRGSVQIKTPNQETDLVRGDVVFVNSGVLHSYQALEKGSKLTAQIFDMHLLSGLYNSIYEEKFFLPVNRSGALEAWRIQPDTLDHLKAVKHVLNAEMLVKDEPEGFELELRTQLSRFWILLLKDTEKLRESSTSRNSIETERIKQMMEYIQEHYSEKITLNDIAASANISTRECSRCFQKNIDISPMIYLNSYRLRMACDMLLETDESILTVSESCGFSSQSYFGRLFREATGCTPAEYRKKS